jgi:hypothetical protein
LGIGAAISTGEQRHLDAIFREDFNSGLFDYKMYKGKAIPLQTWTGPEGSRRLRLPDIKTVST